MSNEEATEIQRWKLIIFQKSKKNIDIFVGLHYEKDKIFV